jgi:hypothetical protein
MRASLVVFAALAACASEPSSFTARDGGGTDASTTDLGARNDIPPVPIRDGSNTVTGDPSTCEHAEAARTYVGCDFWPTVLPNVVGTCFHYVVVVANPGDTPAEVTIERGGMIVARGRSAPNDLAAFSLPWVPELKVLNGRCDTEHGRSLTDSARVTGGAYHLVSSRPVIVYQFNPLEYRNDECNCLFGAYSFSNDASLLLPSTAATGNYRITAMRGQDTEELHAPGYVSVTGLRDNTTVRVRLAPNARVVAGNGIAATAPGQTLTFTLGRGDVARLLGTPDGDLGGSLVQADAPVQVFAGSPCIYQPFDRQSCDHIEESVFPAETLGRRYFVHRPTGPRGNAVGHVVRIFGNVDDTRLTWPGGAPPRAPTRLSAGEVYDLGVVDGDYEVAGDHEFGVATFMLGQTIVDPAINGRGDPSQTNVPSVEQFRDNYVFLAPSNYDVSFADVVMPLNAQVTLDGQPVTVRPTPIGGAFGVARLPLDRARNAHTIRSSAPVGVQVMGYGHATSYHYPAGLNLMGIAPPPPV